MEYDPKGDKWTLNYNTPTQSQKDEIMALLLTHLAVWCMEHHLYKFNDKIYLQQRGCPIGLQVAVSISRLVMIAWDGIMLTCLISANIRTEMMLRYVDDVDLVARVQHLNKSVSQLEHDVCDQVVGLADAIYPGVLEFEGDVPAKHDNGKIAVLDTECWVEQDIVMFQFYKKDCSTDAVIGPDSGFTHQVVRNIVLQQYLRRLLNCSRTLVDETKFWFLSRFNLDLTSFDLRLS